jgi:mannose-6-phosphate isomerase-like protein (cupin superfamily)
LFVSGHGEMWRKQENLVESGVALTIPLGTEFQFRSFGPEPLGAVGVTMPVWPGDGEAIIVEGKWKPCLT